MGSRLSILLAVTVLFWARGVFAETTFNAEVDKTSITAGQAVTYKLTVTSTERVLPVPVLPKFEGFRVLSQVRSSDVSLGRGEVKNALIYTYILVVDQPGRFKIEPAEIKINNKILSTEGFEIEVKEGEAKPQPEEELPLPEEIQPESEQPLRVTI